MNRDFFVPGIGLISMISAVFLYNTDGYRIYSVPLLVLTALISIIFSARIAALINRLNEARCTARLPILWGACVLAVAVALLFE